MKAEIRPSGEMKDSGIAWVGLIPDSWNVIPNKYVMHKEKNLCKNWTGEDVMSLTMNGVIVRDLQNPTGKMPTTFDGYQYIADGDLLMCLFDIDVTPRCVGKVTHNGVTSPAYSNFKVHNNASRDYFYYYYLMVDNTKELLHLAKNLRHSFTEEQLGQLKVPMPPLSEQQAIADCLDKTCSQIDEIIAEAKASIEEYKELKQAVIFEAVTKGLDKDAEMKNSGVAWIGATPKTWDILLLKYMCTMQAGKNLISEQIAASGQYPVYGGNGLRGYFSSYNTEGRHILVGRQGALCGNVHNVAGQYWCTEHAIVTTETQFSDIDYLFYLLLGMNLNQYASNAAAQPGLAVGNILNVKTVRPSMGEQKEIAKYLNNILPRYDSLISEKQSLISDLMAYKKSLIYELVTGKRRLV